MKKFVKKIFILLIISSVFIGMYCQISSIATDKYNGPNTAEQIQMSFDNAVKNDYNCYFLGNSRIYRDINPDIFTSVQAYNFGHDNDSYNQMYYKLLYLIANNESIEYLIVGTDYFQFSFLSDTRNYVYSKLFPKEYQQDFGDKSWWSTKQDDYITFWSNKQNALLPCIFLLFNRPAIDVNYQKANGQYIVYGIADPEDVIDRDYTILDVQLDYFRKIINTCEENDIKLFIAMPPLWSGETETHSDDERKKFNKMIREELKETKFKENYINYSEENGLSSYTDFIDVTHLTPYAADLYSKYLNEKIFGE